MIRLASISIAHSWQISLKIKKGNNVTSLEMYQNAEQNTHARTLLFLRQKYKYSHQLRSTTNDNTDKNKHMHTHTHTQTHIIHKHSHTELHIHTHTHTHTHTYTNTATQKYTNLREKLHEVAVSGLVSP